MTKWWRVFMIAGTATVTTMICAWLLQPYSIYFRTAGTAVGGGLGAWIGILLTKPNYK